VQAIDVAATVLLGGPVDERPPLNDRAVQASDVRELLLGFQVAEGLGEAELRRELKALAGVDLTPGSAAPVVPR